MVTLELLVKAVFFVSSPSLLVLAAYAVLGVVDISYCIYAYAAILVSSAVIIRPYLVNVASLTKYVDDLAQDKKVNAPDLSLLGTMAPLSEAVSKLHRSWGRKKQQMESMIAEREILVDTIPDILLMLDEDDVIIRTNGAARQRFGQNLAQKKISEVIENESLLNAVQEAKRNFRGQDIEFFLPHPTETYFRARIDRFPVHSPGGIAVVVTMDDITELKRTEQMRADFVANASHEIRTPLASLIGFIETLQGPAKDDEGAREQFLKIMNEQAGRMSRLVNDLLSLSKLEMKANTVPTAPVDVSEVVRKVKNSAHWLTDKKNVTIVLNLPDAPLPPARGEESEIYQVVENLVGNAIKYGHVGGTVTVSAFVTDRMPADRNFRNVKKAIAVSVRDEGEGIEKEHIARLTERFYRVNNAQSRKIGGTGLGLAIVKHILNRHRGALTIESEVGAGSVFTVFFHLYRQEKPLPGSAGDEQRQAKSG